MFKMIQSGFRGANLYLFLVGVVMPVAICAVLLSFTGAAFGGSGTGFTRQAGMPDKPLADPSGFDVKLAPGKFLVAARSIADPRFQETVILLVTHDSKGAMGLIINLPTGISLSSALPEIKELRKRADRLFIGGPVGNGQLFLLLQTHKVPEGSLHVLGHTYISSSRKALRRMARAGKSGGKYRVFAGYAGWGPGQLEREVSMGSWYVMEADEKLIFDKAPSGLWRELISRRSGIMVRLLPDDGGIVSGFRAFNKEPFIVTARQ